MIPFAQQYPKTKPTFARKLKWRIVQILDRLLGETSNKPNWYIWMYRNILGGTVFIHFQMPRIGKWKYDDIFRGRDGDWYVRKEWHGVSFPSFSAFDFSNTQPMTAPTNVQFEMRFK